MIAETIGVIDVEGVMIEGAHGQGIEIPVVAEVGAVIEVPVEVTGKGIDLRVHHRKSKRMSNSKTKCSRLRHTEKVRGLNPREVEQTTQTGLTTAKDKETGHHPTSPVIGVGKLGIRGGIVFN